MKILTINSFPVKNYLPLNYYTPIEAGDNPEETIREWIEHSDIDLNSDGTLTEYRVEYELNDKIHTVTIIKVEKFEIQGSF